MGLETIMETVNSELFGVWFLIGAVLVFFMQCGFAMVETGFTRAKNAGNIIMKNLMDFCIGTVMFILLGYGLMCGQDYIAGVIGLPNLGIFTHYNDFNWSNFVFNLVFCATAATIVSGAMAERTKFSAYCIYSAVISAVVYPIEAGWVWNVDGNGWLQKLGFHDYAGSCAIHMVGGIAALIGAIFLGPRIGKYHTDEKTGKKTPKAIPGHSLTLGALGVFILWFAWYGFNGAAATDVPTLASILVTTTVSPAVATCTTMLFTWIKDGKPDVSMSLNGSLAGLVAVTASCDVTDALGSGIIGAVAGILVVLVVELLDKKLHIDDPVGAVAVHMANGIWGTLAVGLFATDKAPGYAVSGLTHTGLFYGGGLHLLRRQREQLSLRVRFLIEEYDIAARHQLLHLVAAWAEAGGVLTLHEDGKRVLRVVCTQFPAMSTLNWLETLSLVFTAFSCPYWEDAAETSFLMPNTSDAPSKLLAVPGDAPETPLNLLIRNIGDTAITTLTISAAGKISFQGLTLAPGAAIRIHHNAGVFAAEMVSDDSTVSILPYRTPDSADDLLLRPGVLNEIRVEAGSAAFVSGRCKGRYC